MGVLKSSRKKLGSAQAAGAATHIQKLSLQEALISSITSILNKSIILSWAKVIERLPAHLFRLYLRPYSNSYRQRQTLRDGSVRQTWRVRCAKPYRQTNTFCPTAARPLYWTGTIHEETRRRVEYILANRVMGAL